MEDPLILDRIMALTLQEDYAALGIDNDMAEFLVSTLSGEMLSMLMKIILRITYWIGMG